MKKKYNKPDISIFPTRTHISTLTPEEPEAFDRSRRNLLIKGGLIATVGHISLYGGSGDDEGPYGSTSQPTQKKFV